jgi:uncharacterized protein YndB with AHSA1/START domain
MQSPTADREIVLSRVFNAPRALVFEAFTRAEHLAHWWGPNGFTTTTHEMSAVPGGRWRFVMHGPNGVDYENEIVYREIVAPERLVYDHGDGRTKLFEVTIRFEEREGGTEVTMTSVFPSAAACEEKKSFGAARLGQQTLARLAEYLPRMT